MMTTKKIKQDGKLIISVAGSVDGTTAPEFESALDGVIDDVTELVFDLKDLKYISSAGLRVLLSALKKMNTKGSMKVKNVNEAIMDIFEITGFNEILTIE